MRLIFLLLAFCALSFAQKDRMVVVISLDGFPAYVFEDPKAPIPTLRALAKKGISARMTTINPTVTWPNHTAMVTGVNADQHGLLVNGTLAPTGSWPPVKNDPMIPKEKMVHVPTVYDAAYKAGLTTAQIDWVAIEKAPTITYPFPEWASPEGKVEQEMLRKGVISEFDVKDFTKHNILYRDQIWAKAAVHLIKEHKPNLLLLHFLSLDSTHHSYGPGTLAANDAIAFLDGRVEEVVNAVREAGMESKTTFLIVSDHGFKRYTKTVSPGAALKDIKAHVIPEGGTAYVYIASPDQIPQAKKALEVLEGIDRVIGSEGFASLGMPTPQSDPQMSQLFLTAKDGYSFSGAMGGPVTAERPQQGGSHGYVNTDPEMDALFISAGYGVPAKGAIGKIANKDVASTIAKLLGVSLPTSKGKAIY